MQKMQFKLLICLCMKSFSGTFWYNCCSVEYLISINFLANTRDFLSSILKSSILKNLSEILRYKASIFWTKMVLRFPPYNWDSQHPRYRDSSKSFYRCRCRICRCCKQSGNHLFLLQLSENDSLSLLPLQVLQSFQNMFLCLRLWRHYEAYVEWR